MKVLWISNVIFPEVCLEIKVPIPAVGGWMHAGALALLKANAEIRLTVVALYNGQDLRHIKGQLMEYYLVPNQGGNQEYNSLLEKYFVQIKEYVDPEIVHIHGSEYPHSLAWVKACGSSNVVISIQGLVSIYSEYFLGGIPPNVVQKYRTIRDILRNDSLFQQQIRMSKRGSYEKQLIRLCNHVIGRTSWDRSNCWALNPAISYHFCNETLRPKFYIKKWDFDKCKKHTIFLSQAHYPIKGLHQVISALPIILRQFPDTKIIVAGNDFMNAPFLKRNGFSNFILSQIRKLNLAENIQFVGMLNEEEMVEMYLKAHVFVCPSSIENSPNSVGEAQLLGTPCVASYVGGTMDMVNDGNTGFLYRFEEVTLMAMRICEIFGNRELADQLSSNGRSAAFIRHDGKTNANQLNSIYEKILNETVSTL